MPRHDHPSAANQQVARMTAGQLTAEVANLRQAADRLQNFLAGGPEAWNVNDTLALHQLAVRVQSGTSVLRQLDQAEERTAGVVRLDEHR